MMELVKKHIHTNRRSAGVISQVTLDEDFNVPDTLDDVEHIILCNGELEIESAKNLGERAAVRGKLKFCLLYRTPSGKLRTLAGGIPFDENINMPGLSENDYMQTEWEVDDLNIGIINSRKLNVKSLVTFRLQAETIYDAEAGVDVRFDGEVEFLKRSVPTSVLSVRRKDTFRVRDTFSVSANKPDVDTILWQDLRLRGVNTKPLDGKIHIDGELMVFLIYTGGSGDIPVQCIEEAIPFSGDVELAESLEEMIPFIAVRLLHKDVEISPDADGEMRELSVDAVIELEIRLYEEEELELLSDLYALDRELVLESDETYFDQIAARNLLKNRIQEKVELPLGQRVLQICHCGGDVRLDEVRMEEGAMSVDGVLEVQLLYLTTDDAAPVSTSVEMLPFHVTAQMPGITEKSMYRAEPYLEQISAVMLGGEGVEIKAVVAVDTLLMNRVREQVILDLKEESLDMEKLKQLPGIVGYVVQPGDSLWKIARKFHTSVDEIMTANGKTDSAVHAGDKLVLVKK